MSNLFNLESYYSQLKTRRLGRPCVYLDQVESTIDVASKEKPDTLVVAKEQTRGRGQRNNVWHSPVGCAMGSIKLACQRVSPLAKRLCFMQHILALMVARTLEQIDGSKLGKKQVRLKWPNDIVVTNTVSGEPLKIGGVLVHTKEQMNDYDIVLSFGLNISNQEPTTCVNEIIGPEKSVAIDSIVAELINNLEHYTYDLNDEKFQQIKLDYTERCMQINKLIQDETHGRVKVMYVNDDGYLVGKNCSTNNLCTITKII